MIADRLRPVLATVSSSPLMVTLCDEQLLNVSVCSSTVVTAVRVRVRNNENGVGVASDTFTFTSTLLPWGHEFELGLTE